jgi:hypothetical protein
MATIHRAKVTFRAKEPGSISVQQLGGDAEILPDNLYFELAHGSSYNEARKIAAYLNETIKGISLVTSKKAGGTGDEQRGIH